MTRTLRGRHPEWRPILKRHSLATVVALLVASGCASTSIARRVDPLSSTDANESWLRFVPADRGSPALAKRLTRAHDFAEAAVVGVPRRDDASRGAVNVSLLDEMKSPASAHGPERISVSTQALSRDDVDGIFAHELTHVLDLRKLKDNAQAIPRYLMEGRGLAVGFAYRRSIRQHARDDDARIQLLQRIGADEADSWLRRFRTGADARALSAEGKLGRAMAVGVFFVDWLRIAHGASAFSRLTRAFEAVGNGTPLDDAIKEQFGATLAALEAAFVTHLRETEGDAAARLRGAMYERAPGG